MRQGSIVVETSLDTAALNAAQLNGLVRTIRYSPAALFDASFLTTWGVITRNSLCSTQCNMQCWPCLNKAAAAVRFVPPCRRLPPCAASSMIACAGDPRSSCGG
jgi:hypothetical protein